jgi:hypothetical protein
MTGSKSVLDCRWPGRRANTSLHPFATAAYQGRAQRRLVGRSVADPDFVTPAERDRQMHQHNVSVTRLRRSM